jgi:uncharacterized protein
MRLYSATSDQFIRDIRENLLTDIMANNFHMRFGRMPANSELNSWQNSLPRVRDLIELAGLLDNMVTLEYEVPYNQERIDCLLFGKGADHSANIVLIELKQWTSVKALEDEGNFVETYIGGAECVKPHPSQQAKGYHNHLKYFVSEFENPPTLVLFSCSYCHNYKRNEGDGLFNPIYQPLIDEFPVFTKEDVHQLANRIKDLLSKGKGFEIFNRFMQSPIRPSIKLLEKVSKVIKNEAVFSLLSEQLEAKNVIWSKVRKAEKSKKKSVIIVHGGPGTGKSVIAINVLAEVAQLGKKVFYGCKSKAFTEGLKKLVGKEGELLFSNLYRFLPTKVKENELDLLLVDEAHRIEKKSNHQYTKPEDRTEMPQIEQLIRCAKTSVFFIDDKQNVRSQEIGNSELIRDAVKQSGCNLSEVTLNTQYRCMGSNDYLLWLESVLGYTNKKRILRKNEVFDFKIFNSPQEIYDVIRKKEDEKRNSARMVAGFCWPWSQKLDADGNLVNDIVIGDFAMPWETHGNITRPPAGFVKWYEWAYRPEGVKQIGCIYTAQGFEFDYIGVIIGADLIYDQTTDSLKADITATKDPTLRRGRETFESHVRNIYRTLLSRGMKGCYVYFVDKDTERFFRSRIEKEERIVDPEVLMYSDLIKDHKVVSIHDRILSIINQEDKFREYLPVYSLKAAAGKFGQGSDVHEEGWVAVSISRKLNKNMFVAKVVGHSMEPLIPNNSYCVFNANVLGSRQGKIVLVQHHDIFDIDTSSSYTVKRYRSEKKIDNIGSWQHEKITLESLNKKYEPIILIKNLEDEFKVIAEFVAVI